MNNTQEHQRGDSQLDLNQDATNANIDLVVRGNSTLASPKINKCVPIYDPNVAKGTEPDLLQKNQVETLTDPEEQHQCQIGDCKNKAVG